MKWVNAKFSLQTLERKWRKKVNCRGSRMINGRTFFFKSFLILNLRLRTQKNSYSFNIVINFHFQCLYFIDSKSTVAKSWDTIRKESIDNRQSVDIPQSACDVYRQTHCSIKSIASTHYSIPCIFNWILLFFFLSNNWNRNSFLRAKWTAHYCYCSAHFFYCNFFIACHGIAYVIETWLFRWLHCFAFVFVFVFVIQNVSILKP